LFSIFYWLIGNFQFPYLNWEEYSRVKLVPGTQPEGSSRLKHARKTLDQFYYPGLRDTLARNKGQTASKWTGQDPPVPHDGRKEAVDDSRVVMVDQIWLWALNDGMPMSHSKLLL
jgi:hypothetical protein